MKKAIKLLGLSLVCGALTLGFASKQKAKEVKADYEWYIPMESAFFTNWSDAAGSFGDSNSTFWGDNYSFQALDSFYRGESAESWKGTLVSRTWKQHTQYIYFQIGGAKNYDVTGDPVHINIYYGNHVYNLYNNTFVENPMLLRYFKIPDSVFAELTANNEDFDMHIEIVDQQSSGYGFVNFGYLHVNSNESQVSNAMRFYLNHMNLNDREWEVNKRKQILENYYLNNELRSVFLRTVDDISEDFESNSRFVDHWYFDYKYAENMNWALHFDRAIGTDSYRPEASTNMPFNNTGDGFFRGWFENDEIGGFVGGDGSRYRFLSRPFVLSGTGLISIKMAGTASLHVIDTATDSDLVWADLLTYNTSGDQVNLATSGFNTVTMVRHVINLEAYLGRTIQLGIADVSTGGWSALYVDELVTNYATYPSFKVDTFAQTNTSGTFNAYRTDKYINSTVFNGETNPNGLKYVLENEVNKANDNEIINHVDNTPIKDAYNFLQTYYSSLRSPANEFNYDRVTDEVKTSVVNAYKALSSDAKAIVDSSIDIEYLSTFEAEWWKNPVTATHGVIDAFNALVNSAAVMHTISFDGNGGTSSMGDVSKEEGSTYALPGNGFTAPEGYKFSGWTVGDDSTLRQPGYEITVTEDVVIHAQWELIPVVYYTLSFDGNGGLGSMTSLSLKEGSTYELPANEFTAPSGYKFIGWKVGNDATLRDPGYEITVNDDVVIHAQWELIPISTYTISFNANGGSGSMKSIEKQEGSTYVLPKATFRAPSGKQFAGWKVNNTGDLLLVGAEITISGDVTLYAQWEDAPVVNYVVSFYANGGTGTMQEITVARGETFIIPECGFTAPEGKEFSAWLIGSVKYQPGQKITISGNTRFDALWVNIVEESSEDESKKEQSEQQSNEPKNVIEKVSQTFQDIINKIVEFFKNLFANFKK